MKYPNSFSPGFIYVMRGFLEDSVVFKIGKSGDVSRRLQDGKTMNPGLELVTDFAVYDSRCAELMIQEYFESRGQRGDGEWFHLDSDDLDWFCNLDDVTMNSWLLGGCPSFKFVNAGSVAPALWFNDGECRRRIFRLWTILETGETIEQAFPGKRPSREMLATMWKNHKREVLISSVIRSTVTVEGEKFPIIARAQGNWKTSQWQDALFRAAQEEHEPITPEAAQAVPVDSHQS